MRQMVKFSIFCLFVLSILCICRLKFPSSSHWKANIFWWKHFFYPLIPQGFRMIDHFSIHLRIVFSLLLATKINETLISLKKTFHLKMILKGMCDVSNSLAPKFFHLYGSAIDRKYFKVASFPLISLRSENECIMLS